MQGWIVQAYGIPEGTPIVLLHGFMQDASSWLPVAEALATRYHVTAPTMEPLLEDEATLEALAEGVHGVVQQALLHTRTRKAVVVGYSLGGRVALEYARRYPDTLAGLVLESASMGPRTEQQRSAMQRRNLAWADQIHEAETMEEVVAAWEAEPLFESQRRLASSALAAQRKMRLRMDKEKLSWIMRRAGSHTMPPSADALAMLVDLGVPVLYAAGLRDGKYAEEANRLDDLGAELVHTARFACGHNVHLESPVAYAERLLEFMKEIA